MARASRAPRAVAWLHSNLGFGGGERVLVEQVRALAARGNPVDVWTTNANGPQDLEGAIRAANPRVRDIGPATSTNHLAREIRRRGYEAVVTCWTTRGYRAVHEAARRPFARRPVVVETVHERYGWCLRDHKDRRRDEVDFWLATYDFRAPLRAAFDLDDARIGIARPLFPDLLPKDPAGARTLGRALRRARGIPDEAVVVGYVGRISGNKGLHHVLPAAARIAARGADVHLLLAGRYSPRSAAYEARFEAALREAAGPGAPLEGRVHLLGAVEDGAPVYAASDVVTLLTSMEGYFPLMLVEALGHGVPVVTTDVRGIGECLADGRDARVVRKVPDDELDSAPAVVEAFEAALEAVVRDPVERARLGAAGRARVEALVRGNDFHADTLSAYERALTLGRLRR